MNTNSELQPSSQPYAVIYFDLSRNEKRMVNQAAAIAKMKPATYAKTIALAAARAAVEAHSASVQP